MRDIRFKPLFLLSLLLSLLSVATVSYALPFTIVPAAPLPRFITPGGTAVASYTVTNNTGHNAIIIRLLICRQMLALLIVQVVQATLI